MLRAIYKGGSSVILPNPNDIDYFYYYDSEEERKEALIKNHDHSVDNHYKLYDKRAKVFLGCYNYPNMEYISGEHINEFETFDIFEESIKTQYLEVIKRKIAYMSKNNKQWYHLVILYYMYSENRKKLTKAQLKIAQKTHDEGVSDEMYNKIVDYFSK